MAFGDVLQQRQQGGQTGFGAVLDKPRTQTGFGAALQNTQDLQSV